ncbi:type 4a pilus biogenesis protein PilO [Candidatus Omnitrophota bacterium]
MKINIPKDKKSILRAVIPAILSVLFFIFFFIPKHSEISNLKKDIRDMESQIKETQDSLGDIGQIKDLLVDMQQELQLFKNRLPDRREVASVLSELSNLAKKHSVDVLSVQSEEPKQVLDSNREPISLEGAPIKYMQVKLKLKSSYIALAEYIKDIQGSLNILATIDELDLNKNEKIAPKLGVDLMMHVYIIDEG